MQPLYPHRWGVMSRSNVRVPARSDKASCMAPMLPCSKSMNVGVHAVAMTIVRVRERERILSRNVDNGQHKANVTMPSFPELVILPGRAGQYSPCCSPFSPVPILLIQIQRRHTGVHGATRQPVSNQWRHGLAARPSGGNSAYELPMAA